jgi:hypothetical protein
VLAKRDDNGFLLNRQDGRLGNPPQPQKFRRHTPTELRLTEGSDANT